MTTKRQFLDPIGAGCRFVLLKSFEPNAKLRINDHTVQVVSDNIWEKMIYRPWVYKDSREDISALYPVIVRFIELYLTAKNPNVQQTQQQTQQPVITPATKTKTKPKSKPKQQNNFDLFDMEPDEDGDSFGLQAFSQDFDVEEESNENIEDEQLGMQQISQQHNQQNQQSQCQKSEKHESCHNEECYKALIIIAEYMVDGMEELQKTYEYGNAVFALQYYIELLKAAIKGKYTKEKLPKHLSDFTTQNFLDNSKIKDLWKDDDIIQLAKLFKLCFDDEKKTQTAIKAYRAAIESMLNDRDNIFRQMISSTNAS